ncbi:hypothetical protein Tco_0083614 [Tanacetum coccineum]
MNHQTLTVPQVIPQVAYQSPQAHTQPMTESPFGDSGFAVIVFSPGYDSVACLNKAMAFLTAVASLRGDKGKIILVLLIRAMLLVQGEILQVDRQELLNATTAKVKDIWLGNALSLSDQGMLHGIRRKQCYQKLRKLDKYWMRSNSYFLQIQEFWEIKLRQSSLIMMLSRLRISIRMIQTVMISRLHKRFLWPTFPTMVMTLSQRQDSMILSVIEQMSEQMINHVNNWEKDNKEQNNESITTELVRYKEMVKTFEQRLNIDLSSNEKMIDSQLDDMIREKLALKEQIDSLDLSIESSYTPPVIVEVPSELPKLSLVNASLKKLKFHLTQFDSVVKKRTTPNALEEDLLNEITEVQIVFDQMDAAVQQSLVDKQCLEIAKKEILLENDRLLHKIMSQQEVFQNDKSCVNHNAVEIQDYFEINDLKAQLQDKDTTISKLKDTIKSLKMNTKEKNVHHEKCDLELINEELENNQCDSLIKKLNLKSVENEDLKAQIQEKVFVITSLKNDLRKSKGKEIVENVVHIPSATTITQGMFKLDLIPLPPRLLQNRDVHINYLRNTQEQANILWGIVEQVKAKQPLDGDVDLACKYATRIQELLVHVLDTYPNAITPNTKKVAVTPMNNVKKFRLAEHLTSSSNIKQVEYSNTLDSNTLVLSSTGVKCSTSICGSKPPGNKKNDRISQTPSKNKKNKVEAQPRKANKMNRVVKPVCDVDVKHSLSNAKSKILCASCNKSMFDGVHDKCLLDLVQNVNNHTKSAKKHKKQNIWKPTGHVFTKVGFKWKPTGRTFTIVGNSCPLTRFTSTNVVPLKQTTSHSDDIKKPELKVYS